MNKSVADLTVMIMAGGTGGHVFPALAVAEQLRSRGAQVLWLGTARGIETRLVPEAGIPLYFLRVEGVRGRGLIGIAKAPFLILVAVLQALKIIYRERPDVVVGFGGFASGPGGLAAFLMRRPLVIHEQNAVAGTTNRLLSRIAARVLAAFSGAFESAEVVGNPVRTSIHSLPAVAERYQARIEAKARQHLLVLGGSLGAKAINELLPDALAAIPVISRPEVWHQTGKQHDEVTLARYMQKQVSAKVEPFINDMAAAYAWADVVICRAGALTVSELAAAGVAAIFIPLPSAIDDHQTRNAAILVEAGAALSFRQQELTSEKLTEILLAHMTKPEVSLAMAKKAQRLAALNAASRVADICIEVACG